MEDADDPRLGDYTDLTDVALRRRREPAEGLFIAEGEKVIRRAVHAGYGMRSMLLSEKRIEPMRDVVEETAAPAYVVGHELAERVTGYHVHRGVLAAFRRKPLPAVPELLADARRVAVLEAVNDHTNIGAVFRSAAALGMDGVLLSPSCADPLYRRSVKVSMGAVLTVPYARLAGGTYDPDDPSYDPGGLRAVRDCGFTLLALTPDERAVTLEEAAPERLDRVALLLGAEGGGLSAGALRRADRWVRIPLSHGVDSLNVAAAAAVAFYATTRDR